MPSKKIKEKYYRKQADFFILVEKIKLWPSKSGVIHGIKEFDVKGQFAQITTHCNVSFTIRHSKRSRAARWLRNKWFHGVCPACRATSVTASPDCFEGGTVLLYFDDAGGVSAEAMPYRNR